MSNRFKLLSGGLDHIDDCASLLNSWGDDLSNSFDLFSAKRIDSALESFLLKWFDVTDGFSEVTSYGENVKAFDRGIFGLFEDPLGVYALGPATVTGWGILNHSQWIIIEIKYDNVEYDSGSRRKRVWKSATVKATHVSQFFNKDLTKGDMYEFLRNELGSVIKSWHDRAQQRIIRSTQLLTDFNTETFLSRPLR